MRHIDAGALSLAVGRVLDARAEVQSHMLGASTMLGGHVRISGVVKLKSQNLPSNVEHTVSVHEVQLLRAAEAIADALITKGSAK